MGRTCRAHGVIGSADRNMHEMGGVQIPPPPNIRRSRSIIRKTGDLRPMVPSPDSLFYFSGGQPRHRMMNED